MKLIATTILLMLTLTAQAEDTITWCEKSVATVAEYVMIMRQQDNDMVALLKEFPDNSMAKMMIVQAFEQPRYSGPQYRLNATADFKNKWMLLCLEARKDK